jgi:6,7-dimethyl-8-ribityllumazine synthase
LVLIDELQGNTGSVSDKRFAIVVSRYHHSITRKLLDGAVQTLTRNLVPANQVKILWVPGAWEIPTAVQHALESGVFDAILAFGCVIRGETTHDQHINTTVSNGLGRLSLDYKIPVAFGVLTCNSMEQAIERSGGEVGNKGVETAEAAVHMLLLLDEMQQKAN